jgi:hypothetical protein
MSLPNINHIRELQEQRLRAEAELKMKQEMEALARAQAKKAQLPAEIEAYKKNIIFELQAKGLPISVREPPEDGYKEISEWLEASGYRLHSYYRHGFRYQVVDPKCRDTWGQSK